MNLKYFIVFLLLTLSFILSNCERRHTTVASKDYSRDKPWYHENDFLNDDLLYAKLDTPVILDLGAKKERSHYIRYAYDKDSEYLFCIDSKEKFITGMTLIDERDSRVYTLLKEEGCKHFYLHGGKYSMEIIHDPSSVPKNGTVSFISHMPSHNKNSNISESGISETIDDPLAYYPLQVSEGDHNSSYLAVSPISIVYYIEEMYEGQHWIPSENSFLSVVSVTDTTTFETKQHLFALNKNGLLGYYDWNSTVYFVKNGSGQLMIDKFEENDAYFVVDSQNPPEGLFSVVFLSQLNDYTTNPSTALSQPVNLYLHPESKPDIYTLWNKNADFWVPESSLYIAENNLIYQTVTSVGPKLATYFKLDKRAPFYKEGSQYTLKENEIAISDSCDLSGEFLVIDGNISNLPEAISYIMPQIKSVRFSKKANENKNILFFTEENYHAWYATVGIGEKTCLDEPLDLSSVHSIQVLNAKKIFLSSHQCEHCNLMGADFSNMTLDNVSLKYSNLANVSFNNSIMQNAQMCYAELYGANLNYVDLSGSVMYGAFLNGNALSNNMAATLQGAYMKNVNLAGAKLNGTSFQYADFHTNIPANCIPTDCNKTSCASLAYASLNGTNMSNAYMTGTDFSYSTIISTNFSNAVLTGAKFTNASISRDLNIANPSNFNGAFLQGTDFTNATIQGTSFTNAYIDLNSTTGNAMYFKFSTGSQHTSFAGWPDKGKALCTLYTYSSITNIPHTDSSIICPDGSTGPCDNSVWLSPKVPMSQSPQLASYITDINPVCDDPNFNW